MSHPHILTSLTEREAVADALHRAAIGFDSNDVSIFNTAWAADPEVSSTSGNVYSGLNAIRTQVFDVIRPIDTMHMISNVRVDVKDGASTASLTAYGLGRRSIVSREGQGPKEPQVHVRWRVLC
jgi:hypothetical protein